MIAVLLCALRLYERDEDLVRIDLATLSIRIAFAELLKEWKQLTS